jgi:hypothetical protein
MEAPRDKTGRNGVQVLLGIIVMAALVTIVVAVLGILMQLLRRRPVHRWALIGGFAVLLIIVAGIASVVIDNNVVAFIAVICVVGAGWYFDRRKRDRWRRLRETADERAATRRVEKEHRASTRQAERRLREAEERRRREQREAEEVELRKQKQAEKEQHEAEEAELRKQKQAEKEHRASTRQAERRQREAEERRRREQQEAEEAQLRNQKQAEKERRAAANQAEKEQREAEEVELRKQKQAGKERRAAAKRIEREQHEAEEATSTPERQDLTEETAQVADTAYEPALKVAGEVEDLPKKLREPAQQNMSDGESIEFYILGASSQAIVALKDRLLVIKPGWMAEAAFGARVTSFYYRDINGIKVDTGLVMGVIEINTPSYQGTQEKDYWSHKNKDRDPRKVTNCLPISKTDLKRYKPHIDRLSTMIRAAKHEGIVQLPAQDSSSLSAELEKLASLRELGALSEEEFQQAKRRVLGQ